MDEDTGAGIAGVSCASTWQRPWEGAAGSHTLLQPARDCNSRDAIKIVIVLCSRTVVKWCNKLMAVWLSVVSTVMFAVSATS